jgi:hypothetical protein
VSREFLLLERNKMAQIYNKTFVKKDGEKRKMKFVRLSELTYEDYDIYSIPPPSGSAPRKYADGNELVWDLDVSNFRVFNWKTVVE